MNSKQMSPQDVESELTLAYLDQLQRDPASPPPPGLDPEFAETIRLVVRAVPTGELSQAAKANIWHSAQLQAGITPLSNNRSQNDMSTISQPFGTAPIRWRAILSHQRMLTAGFATLLIVMLFVVAIVPTILPRYLQGVGNQTATPTLVTGQTGSFGYLMTQPARPIVWSPTGLQFAEIEGALNEKITLRDQHDKVLATLIGHSGRINQLAWSPDGQTLASVGDDKSVRLWTAAGQPKIILSQHTDRVDSVAWSPEGDILASASAQDGTIRLWTAAGDPIRVFQFHPEQNGRLRLYWSPDGTHLGVWNDSAVDIWTRDGQIVSSFSYSDTSVNGFVWSPDGSHYALTTVSNGLQIYSVAGKLEKTLTVPDETNALSTPHWSFDGHLIGVAGLMKGTKNTLHLWDAQSGQLVATGLYTLSVYDMAFSPDGSLIAVGLSDGENGQIEVIDRAAKVLATFKAPQPFQGGLVLAWSPDGQTLLGQFGSQDVQIYSVTPSISAAAQNVTPVSTAQTDVTATPIPTAEASTNAQATADISLELGKTISGELRSDQLSQGYVLALTFDGNILVLLQPNNFAVNLSEQTSCPTGGGGGGGGGSVTGGSPLITPQIFPTCKDGITRLRLSVSSSTGTETGKFTLTVYELKAEMLNSGAPVTGKIDSQTPFHYYQLPSAAGDQIHLKFVSAEAGKLRLTTDQTNPFQMPPVLTETAEVNQIMRQDGKAGVLITPATIGASGSFTLTVDGQAAPILTANTQTIDLSAKQPTYAFRFKGGTPPVLLKVKGQSGVTTATLTVQQPSSGDATALPFGGPAPIPPILTLQVDLNSDVSYKLSPTPEGDYVIFIDLNVSGGADDALRLSLSLEDVPTN